jgi:CheY-like chemotaxis protein
MILLVEDDPGVRASTRSVLEHYGYRVIESDNLEAEQHHRQSSGTIDLLLTDVVMPGIDGAELARRLVARQPNLGVLFMSGYTDSIILHHGIQSSSTAFVQKPFTPLALIEKIRSILDEQSKAD